jgi:putative endonuclease
MAQHNDLGKKGELAAERWLAGIGYQILEVNWRYKKAEVDIIAMDGNELVIVEVKTRRTDAFGEPSAFVSKRKEWLLMDAAVAYAQQVDHDGEIRFDIIGIVAISGQLKNLHHIKDAFFPEIE